MGGERRRGQLGGHGASGWAWRWVWPLSNGDGRWVGACWAGVAEALSRAQPIRPLGWQEMVVGRVAGVNAAARSPSLSVVPAGELERRPRQPMPSAPTVGRLPH